MELHERTVLMLERRSMTAVEEAPRSEGRRSQTAATALLFSLGFARAGRQSLALVADDAKPAVDLPSSLCLTCGLCCNGVLFKDVELQPGDVPSVLLGHGLHLTRRAGIQRLAQPCQALAGCSCRIYPERPVRCRQFECLLFKSVARGQTTLDQALRVVQRARRQAERVRRLLAQLGDHDDSVALSVRFRRMRARFERGLENDESVDRFGELTLATHELNVLLSEAFLPG